ncbi:MAG: PIN domain-containing protein [Dolichospermum sp. DET50]|nr:PIN domain-containing protein [Dolichospermum sp. DET66]MBS3034568.1 PIN domain-containing protein [Dolichospermum sp. DET67]MBS3039771.1 PIN domain-containing protein [Dolichospermum sp. DET50]QSX70744.1 MAG: PIN domain-containing protein [Dolichospermum sp. DET69]
MKILLDTNIIIDNALEREPFLDASEQVLSLIEQGTIAGYISASTVSDLYYIIRKARGRDWTLTYLNQLVTFCQIATVNQAVISMAFTSNFRGCLKSF